VHKSDRIEHKHTDENSQPLEKGRLLCISGNQMRGLPYEKENGKGAASFRELIGRLFGKEKRPPQ
jgi:hypothetical protein